jgi:hypothetical protein
VIHQAWLAGEPTTPCHRAGRLAAPVHQAPGGIAVADGDRSAHA